MGPSIWCERKALWYRTNIGQRVSQAALQAGPVNSSLTIWYVLGTPWVRETFHSCIEGKERFYTVKKMRKPLASYLVDPCVIFLHLKSLRVANNIFGMVGNGKDSLPNGQLILRFEGPINPKLLPLVRLIICWWCSE